MTQKKYRITPEDIDIKDLRKELKNTVQLRTLRALKSDVKKITAICQICTSSAFLNGQCRVCHIIFPKLDGKCPCDVYLKKDVAHVVQYLLLNLKI